MDASAHGSVNQYQSSNGALRILQQQSSRFRGSSFELPRSEHGCTQAVQASRSNVPASMNSMPLPTSVQALRSKGWAFCSPQEVEQQQYPGFQQQQQYPYLANSTRESCMSMESTVDMEILGLEAVFTGGSSHSSYSSYDPLSKPPAGAGKSSSPPGNSGLSQQPSLRRNNSATSTSSGYCGPTSGSAAAEYSFSSSVTPSPASQLPPRPHASPSLQQQQLQQQQFQPRLAPMFDLLATSSAQPRQQSHSSTISCPLPRFSPVPAQQGSRGGPAASKQQQQHQEACSQMLSEMQLQQLREAEQGGAYCYDDMLDVMAPLSPIVECNSDSNAALHHTADCCAAAHMQPAVEQVYECSHPAIGAYITQHNQQQYQHQSCMAAVAAAVHPCAGGLSEEARMKLQQLLAAQQLQMELQAELLAMLPPAPVQHLA